jgi:hypothetical protein
MVLQAHDRYWNAERWRRWPAALVRLGDVMASLWVFRCCVADILLTHGRNRAVLTT